MKQERAKEVAPNERFEEQQNYAVKHFLGDDVGKVNSNVMLKTKDSVIKNEQVEEENQKIFLGKRHLLIYLQQNKKLKKSGYLLKALLNKPN